MLGISGAVLQMLQGQVADGRGSSAVHRSTAELLQWMIAAGNLPPLPDLNSSSAGFAPKLSNETKLNSDKSPVGSAAPDMPVRVIAPPAKLSLAG